MLVVNDAQQETGYISQFERITKHLDSQELNCLVRFQQGISESTRIGT